MGGKKEIYQ